MIAMEKKSTRHNLAENLRYLMIRGGLTEKALETKCGVAQKTINNALNGRVGSSVDTVDKLAACFGLNGWQLISPTLVRDIESGGTIAKLVSNYLLASVEGQTHIVRIAEREAEYTIR